MHTERTFITPALNIQYMQGRIPLLGRGEYLTRREASAILRGIVRARKSVGFALPEQINAFICDQGEDKGKLTIDTHTLAVAWRRYPIDTLDIATMRGPAQRAFGPRPIGKGL